ncbi:hypothetical protein N7492_000986 [Penicillium capsulatum]|uniref:Uncharacterized protein n=1 Tax=Penicillium capsulatum TaxID=69766 RepID=A0A9W9LZH7_9EURO|nr:hypothetical protein N7492_000986 [Penicillium capsulatum]KAJ6129954.1 hypothetical protein N7512_002734 [Penicillium capsulatum]
MAGRGSPERMRRRVTSEEVRTMHSELSPAAGRGVPAPQVAPAVLGNKRLAITFYLTGGILIPSAKPNDPAAGVIRRGIRPFDSYKGEEQQDRLAQWAPVQADGQKLALLDPPVREKATRGSAPTRGAAKSSAYDGIRQGQLGCLRGHARHCRLLNRFQFLDWYRSLKVWPLGLRSVSAPRGSWQGFAGGAKRGLKSTKSRDLGYVYRGGLGIDVRHRAYKPGESSYDQGAAGQGRSRFGLMFIVPQQTHPGFG